MGVCNCGMENEPRTGMNRISGGSFTSPNQYPWMVRLLPRGCGGSLISNRHVLTAKHCFYKDKRWYSEYYPINWVRVGVHDITVVLICGGGGGTLLWRFNILGSPLPLPRDPL